MRSFFFIFIFFLSFIGKEIYAVSITLPSRSEVIEKSAPCKQGGDGMSLDPEKYTCPVGEFSQASSDALTDERVECSVQIALSLYAIDEEAKKWAQGLQSSREKEINSWIDNINNEVEKNPDSFANEYAKVCDIQTFTRGDASVPYGCAKMTTTFPETACQEIVSKKIKALKSTGYMLASKGIAKSFQNDKDAYMDKQKTIYDGMIDKWNSYKRMVGNSVSKFTAYIKNAVK